MANKRLATEYVKACFEFTEAEMLKFFELFKTHQMTFQVKIYENGNQEMVMQDDTARDLVLKFERRAGRCAVEGSFRVVSPKLTNVMRLAIAEFKGSAVVNRIYSYYTMVYHYKHGSVVKIVELKGDTENTIYEYKNTLGQLEELFRSKQTEREIEQVRGQINVLLDRRNLSKDAEVLCNIDQRLAALTHRLFVLEA